MHEVIGESTTHTSDNNIFRRFRSRRGRHVLACDTPCSNAQSFRGVQCRLGTLRYTVFIQRLSLCSLGHKSRGQERAITDITNHTVR